MSISDLYHELIIDHSKSPRNHDSLPSHTHSAKGYNPLCGDSVELFLVIKNDVVVDVGCQGIGCAISIASASLMTEAIKGKSVSEIQDTFRKFHKMVTEGDCSEELGKLASFQGIREFPGRVKCVTMSWHALQAALSGK